MSYGKSPYQKELEGRRAFEKKQMELMDKLESLAYPKAQFEGKGITKAIAQWQYVRISDYESGWMVSIERNGETEWWPNMYKYAMGARKEACRILQKVYGLYVVDTFVPRGIRTFTEMQSDAREYCTIYGVNFKRGKKS